MQREETEEERRARRLAKKAAKEARKAETVAGYSNSTNPFNDPNLNEQFVWGKKQTRDGTTEQEARAYLEATVNNYLGFVEQVAAKPQDEVQTAISSVCEGTTLSRVQTLASIWRAHIDDRRVRLSASDALASYSRTIST